MIQLICNGVEVDVPRGTSIAWKNTNILFAFDKASCERSLTFTLPSTATNDSVFELCRLPQYVGQGFRRLYDAEYRDGLLVKRGYAYVTQSQKSGYNVTLVVGELTALKRLKDAGKVGEILPDGAITVPKAAIDASEPEYSGLKVLKTVHTDLTQNIMPSWCFRPLLVDVLNELQVPFALPSVAEDLRIMIKGLNGAKTSVKFKNVRHSEVTGPTKDAFATDKYNTLSVSDDTWIDVVDMQCAARSAQGIQSYVSGVTSYADLYDDAWSIVGGRETEDPPIPRQLDFASYTYYQGSFATPLHTWFYKSNIFRTLVPLKMTFPSDFPDDVMLLTLPLVADSYGTYCPFRQWAYTDLGELVPYTHVFHFAPDAFGFYPKEWMPFVGTDPSTTNPPMKFDVDTGLVEWQDMTIRPNKSLAGMTIELPLCRFIFVRIEDIACAIESYPEDDPRWASYQSQFIYDLQPRFNDYEFDIEVEADIVDTPTDWTFSKRQNSPDMTAVDMLKTLANVSGKVLYYTDANGITFEDLLTTDFTPLDLTSKLISIKTLKPRFSDYDRANIVKYKDDEMTTQQDMISVDYESNAAMLQGEKALQTLPFSCVSNSRVFVGSETGEYFDRARIVDGNNKKPSADVLLTINANDTFTQRVPLIKNPTIQQLCKEPLTIEATLHMSNYEYSQIQPFSLIHLNGVDYVWTESSWQKNTATLTLSKLPLTLSEPQPTPPPVIYTYYDYLESTAADKQWIDTGVVPNNNTRLICEYFFRPGISRAFVFGARTANRVASFLHRGTSGTQSSADYGTNQVNFGAVTANTRYTIDANKNVWTLTNEQQQVVVRTFTEQSFVTNCTLTLFAMNSNGSTTNLRDPSAIVSAKIYDNGTLVRDFRPAVRIADGVAGMHDVVNDVFYPSANGVNFLYGNF